MAIVAVVGDLATTTAVALAVSWPTTDDVLLVEADPTGGDLAAWFDMPVSPSLSNVVTRVPDGAWPDIERFARIAPTGIRLIPAPAGAAEAGRAVAEAGRSLVGTLASLRSPVVIADVGDLPVGPGDPPFLTRATVAVVVHRQAPQSARAAAVRLQRLADHLTAMPTAVSAVVVALVGAVPFSPDEVDSFLAASIGEVAVVGLPDDPLAAAVIGGRTGVSERRHARLPLMRSARELARVTEASLEVHVEGLWRSAR